MVSTTRSTSLQNQSATSMAELAALIKVAREHEDPDCRLGALQRLVPRMTAPAMVHVLIDRLGHDGDIHILWLCAGLLLDRFGEDKPMAKAILRRLEHEPDPALRLAILDLVSTRLGAFEPVRRTLARMVGNDPDLTVRAEAARTLADLERIMSAPPAPAPVSHSSRVLETWAAVETSLYRATD